MRGVLVVIDGMGDLPHKLLNDKTPLEAAETPNLDYLASRGEMGYMYSVKENFVPESDEAIVSMFGNKQIDSSRGQLEALGAGMDLTRGDLALRVNFATIDSLEEGNIDDRRVGRTLTSDEAKELAKAVNEGVKISKDFEFKSTIQHRGALVFKGGFSDNISGNDKTYSKGKIEESHKIVPCKSQDDDINSIYTANLVNEFLDKTYEVLDRHIINKKRVRKGLLPANYLLVRGAGIEPPKLKQYKNWVSFHYMPLEIGFSKMSGMKNYSFPYPKLKGIDVYDNLWKGLKKACKFSIKKLKKYMKDYEYCYIHIKETDLPGHDNKPIEKREMLEYIDKTLFRFLKKIAPVGKLRIAVTADHSTPCKLKKHSADPVPVLLFNNSVAEDKKFTEKDAREGKLGKIEGKDFLKKIGFVKK